MLKNFIFSLNYRLLITTHRNKQIPAITNCITYNFTLHNNHLWKPTHSGRAVPPASMHVFFFFFGLIFSSISDGTRPPGSQLLSNVQRSSIAGFCIQNERSIIHFANKGNVISKLQLCRVALRWLCQHLRPQVEMKVKRLAAEHEFSRSHHYAIFCQGDWVNFVSMGVTACLQAAEALWQHDQLNGE